MTDIDVKKGAIKWRLMIHLFKSEEDARRFYKFYGFSDDELNMLKECSEKEGVLKVEDLGTGGSKDLDHLKALVRLQCRFYDNKEMQAHIKALINALDVGGEQK